MNCQQVRGLLPLHAYGDLRSDEKSVVDAHLRDCPECRAELAALASIRSALDAIPAGSVNVNLMQIYRNEADRLRRRARRWRYAAAATAVAVVVVLMVRLDVRLDGRQITIRWGAAPQHEPVEMAVNQITTPPEMKIPAQLDERIRTMSELIQALAANVEASDRERQQQLVSMKLELASMNRKSQERMSEAERDLSALYAAQFGSRPKAVNP
jgi:hypothetical protein